MAGRERTGLFMRRIGVHTSIAGGIVRGLERARALGCTTVQIFSHSPRSWAVRDIPPDETAAFVRLKRDYDLSPVCIHTSYLINLASKDAALRARSVDMVVYEMDCADRLDAQYVVIHPGSASGEDPGVARGRIVESLDRIARRGAWRAGLLLENTSGKRGDITSRIGDLAHIVEGVSGGLVSGICFDTCHAFAAGYDVGTESGLQDLSREIRAHASCLSVRLVHVNDSKGELGSGVDRHAHIGEGRIGLEGFARMLRHPLFTRVPLILETPKRSKDDDRRNLERVRGAERHVHEQGGD